MKIKVTLLLIALSVFLLQFKKQTYGNHYFQQIHSNTKTVADNTKIDNCFDKHIQLSEDRGFTQDAFQYTDLIDDDDKDCSHLSIAYTLHTIASIYNSSGAIAVNDDSLSVVSEIQTPKKYRLFGVFRI